VPALGQGADQGTADGGVVFHQEQLCHTSEGSGLGPYPQVDPVSGGLPATRRARFLGSPLPVLKVLRASLGRVHVRILAGVGAWLLGAGTATAGSLLAVSLLGQGIADNPGQQLTAAAVNQALAREAHDASEPGTMTVRPRVRTPPVTMPAGTTPAGTTPAASPAAPAPSATPAAPRAAASPAAGTVLTSPGGTVLAECRPAGAYLVSWSPVQGYEATDVTRGPAATAGVVFESSANSVTVVVSCPAGVAGAPVATSRIRPSTGGTDE
jgi:hypothetical protein